MGHRKATVFCKKLKKVIQNIYIIVSQLIQNMCVNLQAYIIGVCCWDIGEDPGSAKDGIRKKIDKCLEGVPISAAKASELL